VLANPVVEELILAGPTAELAMEQFVLENEDLSVPTPPDGAIYGFGCIRVCPPLRVAKRFRAFVTWVPTGKVDR
jgi:hypothetical protein